MAGEWNLQCILRHSIHGYCGQHIAQCAPGNTQTADQVKVTKFGTAGLGTPYIDPSAFALVTAVRFGNSGRNTLRGPGVVNLVAGLFRNFNLSERWRMQFRV